MKIQLVNSATNTQKVVSPSILLPLGLAYIAASLEQEGYEVEVIDLNIEKDAEFGDADIVGTTATPPLITGAWKVARKAKERGAITIIGGTHVSCLPEESASLPYIDYVVRGEGEMTVKELCRSIENGKEPEGIKGVSYARGGSIIHNPDRPFIKNLDELPFPALHLFPSLDHYTVPSPVIGSTNLGFASASMITSRGCPYNCNFCYKGTFGRVWRPRSPENVLAEWKHLVKDLGVREIGVWDDSFNIDMKRSIRICELIIENDLVVPWSTPSGMRADRVSKELMTKMREAGCYRVPFGVEVGTQEMLDRIGKHYTLDQLREAYAITRDAGIETVGLFMLGLPGDTEQSMEATINFAKELNPDFAEFSITVPYPGSAIYDEIKREGKLLTTDWSDYSIYSKKAFFELGDLNKALLEKMRKRAYRKFYLRPTYIAKALRKSKTWKNFFKKARTVLYHLSGSE